MAVSRKKRQVVYHNNNTDTWTNDDKEQLSLIPGTDGYEARQEQLLKSNPMSEENLEESMEHQDEFSEKQQSEKDHDEQQNFSDAFEKGDRSPASQQYRARMRVKDEAEAAAQAVSEGTGRNVSAEEIQNLAGGRTARVSDIPRAVKAVYGDEVAQREIPTVDTNGDGVVNENDAPYVPGSRKMRRYFG